MYYIRIVLYLSFSFLILNSSPFSVIPSIYRTYKTKFLQNQSFKNCELACHLKWSYSKKIVWWFNISRGNYAIYGYLLSNVKIKRRILPTTKICWNPLLIPCLFPESNLYCAQLPLNLILHPNGIGNNSDLWPSVVIWTLTIFNQWNKNWCQRKRDVKNPF